MAGEDLAAENAQLRAALARVEAQRQPAAPTVLPAVVEGWNRAKQTYENWDGEVKRLSKESAERLAEGRFEEGQLLQAQIATASTNREAALRSWQSIDRLQSAPLVEQDIAVLGNNLSAKDQEWVRRHPSFSRDPYVRQKIYDAHNEAVAAGIKPGSALYYATADAAYVNAGGDIGPARRLSGDQLELERNNYRAAYPERTDFNDPDVVSTWAHRNAHSSAATRVRINDADFGMAKDW